MKSSIAHCLTTASFDHAVSQLRVVETHISWIVLTGLYAYKIKKPVRYPFLDASTLARRQVLCEEELRLNQRLAASLYIDVVPIVANGAAPRVGQAGAAVEYAVRMHQFEPSQELSALLQADDVSEHDITDLALTLADFHEHASIAGQDSPYGTFAAVRQEVLDNLSVLEDHLALDAEARAFEAPAGWTRARVASLETVIARRKKEGAIREGHGDLHARNVVRWRGRWIPFDCLEFDPALRWIDVMSDLGFLFMDLCARRRSDLAFACLSRYLEATGDYGGLQVLPFYAVYRALVRAKVDALAAHAADAQSAQPLHARLGDRLDVAARLTTPRRPCLILMHGVTACGKSWLSERLVPVLRAVRVRSDLERKRMSGLPALARRNTEVGKGPYSPELVQRSYDRLRECCATALGADFNVIADATFLSAANRDMFRTLALDLGCHFLMVSCRADPATLDARLTARGQIARDPSEATHAVLEHQLATQQPLTPRELQESVIVDTDWLTSADAGIAAVKRRLQPGRFG